MTALSVVAPREPEPEEGFRALIDRLPVGLVWLDANARIREANGPALALLESTSGPKLEATVIALVEAAKASGQCIETTVPLIGGEKVRLSVAPDRAPDTFVAVLDRQRLEQARTEAAVLRAVLKALSVVGPRAEAIERALELVRGPLEVDTLGFFELDALGDGFRCEAWSGTAGPPAALGARLEADAALVPPLVDALTHDRPISAKTSTGFVLCIPVQGRSTRGVLSLGTSSIASETLSRVALALCDAIAAVLDLSSLEQEAARAREVAAQRDRLATIGQLVAGVAHEINNPLAFLKSNLSSLRHDLQGLKGQGGALDEVDEIVAESLDGVSRIESIVQALKGTARRKDERLRFEPSRAVAEAVTIFRGAHKQDCEIDVTGLKRLPELMGSPSALGQLTLNLLQNGLDAMFALPRAQRRLEISSQQKDAELIIAFRDFGTGIPPEVQRRMFDAFFTTKDPGKGTGLGLGICKEIAASLKGTLRFQTGPTGTCFELSLPVDPELT